MVPQEPFNSPQGQLTQPRAPLPNSAAPPPKVFRMCLLLIAAIIAAHLVLSQPSNNPLDNPGVRRGDVLLVATNLPAKINDWTQQAFHAPVAPEELPDGQYWWTHSWEFTSTHRAALVSFDQANWHGWHELTECYLAQGWELKERKILQLPSSPNWPCVLAKFTQGHEKLMVIFSMFYEDGDSAIPRDRIEQLTRNPLDRRINHSPYAKENKGLRTFQCQLSIAHHDKLISEDEQSVIQLHHATRDKLRQHWLDNQQSQR